MVRYDTADLINQVKRFESLPTNQQTFETIDFVNLLDTELHNSIVPLIQRTNEEFFVTYMDFNITPTINEVTIPSQGSGLRLRDVMWVNNDGTFSKLARLTVDQIGGYNFAFGGYYGLAGYYIQNNKVYLYPKNTANGTLRLLYFRRPAHLCADTEAGQILNIDTNTNIVTLNNVPSQWGPGTELDALEKDVPFLYKDENFQIINRAGFDITLPAATVAKLSLGDIISEKGTAPVCQYIPIEAFQMLVQTTGMRCLESIGDREGLAAATVKYDRMEQNFLAMISPRVSGEGKKIVGAGGIMGATRINTYTSYW